MTPRSQQLEIPVGDSPPINVYVANCRPENWAICKQGTIFGLRPNNPAAEDLKPGDVLLMRTTGSGNGVREIWYLEKKDEVTPKRPAPWKDAKYDWLLSCKVVAELAVSFSEDFRSNSKLSTKIDNLGRR